MNYKNLILIALALCMCVAAPVAAVWQNGNWFSEEDAPDAVYDSVTGVSSKYVPTDNSIPTDGCGALYIQTLARSLAGGSVFTIQRINDAENVSFVNGARIQKELAESLDVGEPYIFTLDHAGTFDDRYAAGAVYLITLPNGNGCQAEYAIAEMFEFYRTDVVFQGHAGMVGDMSLHIISARYYATAGGMLSKDVTAILQGRVVGNTLTLPSGAAAYNALFAPFPPSFGTIRFLDITYRINGGISSVTYFRGTPFTIS